MNPATEQVEEIHPMYHLPENVIPCAFSENVYAQVYTMIKSEGGIHKTKMRLIEAGHHPSFVRGLIRNICRNRGW